VRSAGITDLRHGYVLEGDWMGHDRFASRPTSRHPLPLPKGVKCYTIAAAIGPAPKSRWDQVIGDGLVPVQSALGQHPDARLKLTFPRSRQWTVRGISHLGLLDRDQVYELIRDWLGA